MQDKFRALKLILVLVIVGIFVWFLVLSPMITFQRNEKIMEDAARRYFELNSDELPTGERVKTLSLSVLFKKSYIKQDFYAPISNKACSVENSWVKVKQENGKYRYYVYLDCGTFTSNVDHKGPVIKLNGKEEMSVNIGEEFTDPGVDSVVDEHDGVMDASNVTVKGEVDTSKVGTYEINYSASDNFNNKSTVTRVVKVVKVLSSVISKELNGETNFKGNPTNNYIRLSNMYFRVLGLDENNNIIMVAEEDAANVSYDKLEKWLDEVYIPHFTKKAQKLLVKTKYCNMAVPENEIDSVSQCTEYTDQRYAYVPSVLDINSTQLDNNNFLKPVTISWTANNKDDKEAYVIRNVFFGNEYGKNYITVNSTYNYGVRPKLVMKGDALVTDGDGTHDNPFVFGETKPAKGGTLLNKRFTGEYITINGFEWRIIETLPDGTTKVISDDTLGTDNERPTTYSNPEKSTIVYDPEDKESYAYFIKNKSSKFIDTKLLIKHEVEIPVYKNEIRYKEETKIKTYKLKVSPPNMFDMFSAQSNTREGKKSHSYWLSNTSNSKDRIAGVISDIGVVLNEPIQKYGMYGIRAVGYVKSDTVITSGKGTNLSPYKLK
ncbi:MAG: DUF5011 domain-containing protein [Bacilli bacterium]|nr:DUF5011 domain-containing protein [Bacilli bacterium]